MSEQHPLDDFFKDRLYDHSYELPAHLWQGVDARLPKKESTKGLPFYRSLPFLLGSAFILGIALSSGFWLWFSAYNTYTPPIGAFPIPMESSQPIAEQQHFQHKKDIHAVATTTDTTLDEKPAAAKRINKNNASSLPPIAKTPNSSYYKNTPLSNSAVLTQKKNQAEEYSAATETDHSEKTAAAAKANAPTTTSDFGSLAYLPAQQQLIPGGPLGEQLTCASFTRRNWDVYIDLMLSPDVAIRTLEAKDAEFNNYARARKTTEAFRYAYSAALRFSTVAENGFAIRSGLNYSEIHEQFNYKVDDEERMTIITEYDTDGITVTGQDTLIEYYSVHRIINNKYTTVDIPLIAGYEFGGDKVNVTLNGGTYINMVFNQKGEFRSPVDFRPVAFSTNKESSYQAYKNRLGLSFYGSVGINFRLENDLQLIMEPHFKWQPNSITDPGYILDQKYLTAGLFVGLRKPL